MLDAGTDNFSLPTIHERRDGLLSRDFPLVRLTVEQSSRQPRIRFSKTSPRRKELPVTGMVLLRLADATRMTSLLLWYPPSRQLDAIALSWP